MLLLLPLPLLLLLLLPPLLLLPRRRLRVSRLALPPGLPSPLNWTLLRLLGTQLPPPTVSELRLCGLGFRWQRLLLLSRPLRAPLLLAPLLLLLAPPVAFGPTAAAARAAAAPTPKHEKQKTRMPGDFR